MCIMTNQVRSVHYICIADRKNTISYVKRFTTSLHTSKQEAIQQLLKNECNKVALFGCYMPHS